MQKPSIVQSFNGVEKPVCKFDCNLPTCGGAHPNESGSVVLCAKWCLEGSVHTCLRSNCPFNHFRSEVHYIKYRCRDFTFAAAHPELVEKYKNCAGYNPAIDGVTTIVYNGITTPTESVVSSTYHNGLTNYRTEPPTIFDSSESNGNFLVFDGTKKTKKKTTKKKRAIDDY